MLRAQMPLAVIVLVALGCGGVAQPHTVDVGRRTIRLSRHEWRALPNPQPFADNFEQTEFLPPLTRPRIVTIFKMPMSEDRRVGRPLSKNEYIQMFSFEPGVVTVRIRVDKGDYWVLSDEAVAAPTVTAPIDRRTELVGSTLEDAVVSLRDQTDTTRALLNTGF